MSPPVSKARSLAACQSGASAVEFAIVCLALMLVTLGVVEFGRALNIRNQISHAADFGARKIMMDRTVSDANLGAAVRSAFIGREPAALDVVVGQETVGGIPFRTITASYPFSLLVPGLTNGNLKLSLTRRTPVI